MATSRFSPATSVANQIRSGVGVKTGGTQGRPNQSHMGLTGASSGGRNTAGSAKGPGTAVTGTFAAAPKPRVPSTIGTVPAGTPAPIAANADPFRKTARGLVRWSQMTAAERAMYGNSLNGKPTVPAPRVNAPAASTGAAPVATTPGAPTGPLDYTGLSSFKAGSADLDYALANDRGDLRRQLSESAVAYQRELGDAKQAYGRQVESSEDEMNRAGLLRSGTRGQVDADRFKEFDRYLADVELNYGSGATAKINEALARLDQYETMQRRALEQQARDEYGSLYPAAPIAEPVVDPAGPVPSAPSTPVAGGGRGSDGTFANGSSQPVGTPAPASAYLRVYVPNGKGGYKIGTKDRNKMSDAELKAALASPLNKGAR